jgi:ATP-dependent Clp protease ATP-binding subunit ClpC
MDWFDLAQERLEAWNAREKKALDYRKSFTPVAQKTLDTAFVEARRDSLMAIGAEHLLLGLLQVREGPVSRVLAGLNLSAVTLRSEIEEAYGPSLKKWLPERLPFTLRMKNILRKARLLAKAQGRDLTDAEHLLTALVGEKEGLPAKLFTKHGIDAKALENRLAAESARI